MNYEKILRAYIEHVVNEESINYLIYKPGEQNPALLVLSEEEYAELVKIGTAIEKADRDRWIKP